LAIPASLHDALMARLDRLDTAKGVAQLGATIGRTFTYELFHAVSSMAEEILQHALARLVGGELLVQRGTPPQATYTFKHALIRDTAYQSQLKSTRYQNHQQIAQVLKERFAETAETQPELLAYHYAEAGLNEPAVDYWSKAGQRAHERSAYVEAIAYLSSGLEMLMALPNTPERKQQELMMHIALANAWMATKGQAAAEVEQAYVRARELCEQLGESPQLFSVLWGFYILYLLRGALEKAQEMAEQCFALAEHAHDPALLLETHRALGSSSLFLGELARARTNLEQGISLYSSPQHRFHASRYGGDPGVVCLTYAALTLWLLGYPDQALHKSREALTLARELASSYSLAEGLVLSAALHQLRREAQIVEEQAGSGVTLSKEQGFAQFLTMGLILQGWRRVGHGRAEESLAQIRRGLASWRSNGAELAVPYFLALLAEAYGEAGQLEKGLNALTEALTLVDKNDERWWEAELYRLKGELIMQISSDNQTEAEAYFQQALDSARSQQAKSLELRTATSLARLWRDQGKTGEAHDLLGRSYGWFTEGFDTADLKDAKALLDELK